MARDCFRSRGFGSESAGGCFRFRLNFGEAGALSSTRSWKNQAFAGHRNHMFFRRPWGRSFKFEMLESKHAPEGLEDYFPVEMEGQPDTNNILLGDGIWIPL